MTEEAIVTCDGCGKESRHSAEERTIPAGWYEANWYVSANEPNSQGYHDEQHESKQHFCPDCETAIDTFVATLR